MVCQQINDRVKVVFYGFFLKYLLSLHAQDNVLERLGTRAQEDLLIDQTGPGIGSVSAQLRSHGHLKQAQPAALHCSPSVDPAAGLSAAEQGGFYCSIQVTGKNSQSFHELAEMAPPCTAGTGKMTNSVPLSTSALLNMQWDTGNTTGSATKSGWAEP